MKFKKDSCLKKTNKSKLDDIFCNQSMLFLFSGRLLSTLGNYTFDFAIAWYILRNGGTSLQSSIVLMSALLPQVILGPFAGVIVDRIPRKKILVSMDFIRAAIITLVGCLMYFKLLPFWLLCFLLFLAGICSSLYSPACNSLIPDIVEKEEINKANSIDSLASNISRILGPLLGGALYTYFGMTIIVCVDGISFLLSALLELFIVVKYEEITQIETGASVIEDLVEGYRYIKGRPGLYLLLWFYVAINFLSVPIIQIYFPYTYNNILKTSTAQLTMTNFAFGLGFVIGAIISSVLPQKEKYHNRICRSFLVSCCMVLGFSIPLFPFIFAKLSVNSIVFFYSALAVICGTFMMLGNIPLFVIFQRDVDDSVRGRVFALMNTFTNAATPLGYLVAGWLVGFVPMYMLIFVIGIIVVMLNIMLMFSKSIVEL